MELQLYLFKIVTSGASFRSQPEVDAVIARLANDTYKPALPAMGRSIYMHLGGSDESASAHGKNLIVQLLTDGRFGAPHRSRDLVGEVFFVDGSVLLIQPSGKNLIICEVRRHDTPEHLERLTASVADSARLALDGRRLRGMSFEWTDITEKWVKSYTQRLRRRPGYWDTHGVPGKRPSELKTQPATLTAEDTADARLLVRLEQRLVLQRLLQVGKARSVDARQDADPEIVDPLLGGGLMRKEFLVVCRKDQSTLCTAETKDEIEAVNFKCSSCGRAYREELVHEIYAPTDRSRKLLNGSHWMTIWITELLRDAGLKLQDINWGATAGEDELDIVVTINGVSIFFELKDREFGLGDAYPFSSRVQRYGGDFGIIVSMDKVAEEVSKYLREQRGTVIHTLAGEVEIRERLPVILEEISTNAAIDAATSLLLPTGIDLDSSEVAVVD